MVPEVVRLKESGVCVCGQHVAAGERAGWAHQPGRVVCLSCLAAFSTAEEEGTTVFYEAPESGQDDSGLAVELPEPVAVLIPADWASPAPITLPAWQRSAGVDTVLPPAAPSHHVVAAPTVSAEAPAPSPSPVAEVPTPAPVVTAETRAAAEASPAPVVDRTPSVVAEVTTPHTEVVTAQAVPEVLAPEEEAVPATVEATAMTVPSHRRRTLLPAGLLALRSSRGRQPGATGQADSSIRAFLQSAAGFGVLSLHDRRMPGRRGRIAHVALGAGGVYVIDVVRAKNAAVEVQELDDLDPDARELVVDGRPMTDAVIATQGRAAIVRGLLDEVQLTTVPTIGVICFVDASVPSDADLAVAGIRVVDRTGLSALVGSDGALDEESRETLLEYLSERLPA